MNTLSQPTARFFTNASSLEHNCADEYDSRFMPSISSPTSTNENTKDLQTDGSSLIGCFAAGTLIDTATGVMPIEDLEGGTLIRTFKNGCMPLQQLRPIARQDLPTTLCRLSAGYLDAVKPLLTVVNQPIRLTHWLGAALFQTRFPFVLLGQVKQEGKVDFIQDATQQFFQIDLGVTDAIYANGAMCIVTSQMKLRDTNLEKRKTIPFDFRLVAQHEISQVLEANVFFRPQRKSA